MVVSDSSSCSGLEAVLGTSNKDKMVTRRVIITLCWGPGECDMCDMCPVSLVTQGECHLSGRISGHYITDYHHSAVSQSEARDGRD